MAGKKKSNGNGKTKIARTWTPMTTMDFCGKPIGDGCFGPSVTVALEGVRIVMPKKNGGTNSFQFNFADQKVYALGDLLAG